MNSENSKTPKPHVLVLKLTNKLDLRMGKKVIALSNLSIYCTWKNIKSSYNSNKFNPNLDGIFRGSFWGGGRVKLPPPTV